MERLALRTHSKARMTKLATGMARMICMRGENKIPTAGHLAPAAASAVPHTTASTKPARMRSELKAIRYQNSAVGKRRANACSVPTGVVRKSPPWPSAIAASCQTITQNAKAPAFCSRRL